MNIESIIAKFGYSNEISNYLRNIYPYLVSYFKDEKIVFETLNNVPIVLCEDLYDCLVDTNMLGALDEGAVASPDVIRDAFGGYITNPQFSYNSENGSFSLKESRQMIALNTKTITDFEPTLIHEVCHAVKSYNNQYKVDGNTAVEYSGFMRRNYILNVENGVVKRNLTSEMGVGFEEALNEMAEERIYSAVSKKEYVSDNYRITKDIAKGIFNYGIEDIENIIFEAQMYHDNSKLDSMLGDGFYSFVEMLDKVYEKNLEYLDCLSVQEQMNVLKEVRAYINVQYPLVEQQIKSKINNTDMDM